MSGRTVPNGHIYEGAAMYRILIAGFEHETNTFSTHATELEDFRVHIWIEGAEMLTKLKGNRVGLGAFIDLLGNDPEYELVPAVYAAANPGAAVTKEAFDTISGMITGKYLEEEERAAKGLCGHIDGILLQLHGAQISEYCFDAERMLLERLRTLTGPDLPVIATLDFHANLTQKMVSLSTALFPSRLYPHTDLYERGADAVALLKKVLAGSAHPTACMKQLRLIYPHMPTDEGYLASMIPEMENEPQKNRGVISTGFVAGFTRADIPIQGSCIYSLTENDPSLASAQCEKYADDVYRHLEEFRMDLTDPSEAVRLGMQHGGLTVIADAADNPGSGLMGDATEIIHELLRRKAEKVIVYAIWDPETAAQAAKAGPGAVIRVRLGGKSSQAVGASIETDAYVKSVSDGKYRIKGPMYHGLDVCTGTTAVLVFEGITCVVTSVRRQNYDEEGFRSNGIEPSDYSIVVVKSAIHYRSAWKLVSDQILTVDMPNLTPLDEIRVPYRNLPRPIYPLESADEVRASAAPENR